LRSDPTLMIGGWLELADAPDADAPDPNRGFTTDATLMIGG
jgi:hypothetical protein